MLKSITTSTEVDTFIDTKMENFIATGRQRMKSGESAEVGEFSLGFGDDINFDDESIEVVKVVHSSSNKKEDKSINVNVSINEDTSTIPEASSTSTSTSTTWNRPYTLSQLDAMTVNTNEFDPGDTGNAQRFQMLFGDKFKYMSALKSWFKFTSKHWEICKSGEAETAMHETILAIKDELYVAKVRTTGTPEGSPQKAHLKALQAHYRTSSNATKISDALRVAKMFDSMKISHDELDGSKSAHLFNAKNGTVNLKNGTVQPFDSGDFISKTSAYDIADNSDCPMFKKFLNEIFLGDEELSRYMIRVIGGAMIGERKKSQEFYLLQGMAGSNGKSTLLSTVLDIFGTYGISSKSESWIGESKKDGASHTTDLVRLDNARLIAVSELPKDKMFNESRIKSWTGGDVMTARDLGVQEITIRSHGTLLLSSNHRQRINASDSAMWRRNKSIPFHAKFSTMAHEKVGQDGITHIGDSELIDNLKSEYPQIFRLFVEAAIEYQQIGLRDVPDAVTKCIESHKDSADTVKNFLDECCERFTEQQEQGSGKKVYVETSELYKAYTRWITEENGMKALNRKNFIENLVRHGIKAGEPSRYQNRRVMEDIVLHRTELSF